jgi:hypothetical protein
VALEEGFSGEEIRNMLSGTLSDVPQEELAGVLFAQHYADTRGNPSPESWRRIEETYGETGAYGVLAVTRMIMFGNATGIPAGSFINRFRKGKKPDTRSNIAYELAMMLAARRLSAAGRACRADDEPFQSSRHQLSIICLQNRYRHAEKRMPVMFCSA